MLLLLRCEQHNEMYTVMKHLSLHKGDSERNVQRANTTPSATLLVHIHETGIPSAGTGVH